ncbi:MAG: glycosyltransferase, partial [Ilumatobacteraceae bacterium]
IELITAGSGHQRERHPWWHHFGSLQSKSELAEFYSQCDLLVSPSLEESFGMTLIEAGLSGIPVVAPRNSGAPEFIKHGWSGFICDSVDDLQATLTLAHQQRELLPTFGERLQQDLQDALNEDRIMNQFLALYERCAAHGAGSDSG